MGDRQWLVPGARVVIARPPHDCDVGGTWIVESVCNGHASLLQGPHRFGSNVDRLEPAEVSP